MAFGLAMCAIGLRHRGYRAEVQEALARPAPADEAALPSAMRRVLATHYEAGLEDPEAHREHVRFVGRELLRRVGADVGPAVQAAYEQLPDEVAIAMLRRP